MLSEKMIRLILGFTHIQRSLGKRDLQHLQHLFQLELIWEHLNHKYEPTLSSFTFNMIFFMTHFPYIRFKETYDSMHPT